MNKKTTDCNALFVEMVKGWYVRIHIRKKLVL